MNSLSELHLESNSKIKINFNGGDLSSDSGLFLIKEFASKIGFEKQINTVFRTNDKAVRQHIDPKSLLQKIYQIIAGYFNNNDFDELTNEPVLNANLYQIIQKIFSACVSILVILEVSLKHLATK